MLKNKFLTITIFMVMILSIMVPFVKAENEAETPMPISSSEQSDSISSEVSTEVKPDEASASDSSVSTIPNGEDESFKKSDIYLTGDNVTIDYIIDGNLFVIANTVTINSQIGGDAFICANTVTVEEEGYIFSNLFTISQNVTIKGVVYDLYALSDNTTISGYVYRDIKVATKDLTIHGTVGRNAFVDCNTISFGEDTDMVDGEATPLTTQGSISGDLNYVAPTESTILENSVAGKVNYTQTPTTSSFNLSESLMTLGSMIASTIIIWLLCLWIAPNFLKRTHHLLATKKILPVIGLGIVTPIVLTIAMIILFLIGITASIGFLALALMITLMMIATSIFVIAANSVICQKLKIEKTIGSLGMLIICSVVLWAIKLIPYVGAFVGFIAVVLGLGIIIYSLIFKEKTLNSEEAKTVTE